jgi:hypothetical protein
MRAVPDGAALGQFDPHRVLVKPTAVGEIVMPTRSRRRLRSLESPSSSDL